LKYGGEVKFYNVSLDLKPDFTDIKSKIDGKTRAILAVHYFGFPQPIRQFRELCQEHGLYLIEVVRTSWRGEAVKAPHWAITVTLAFQLA